ncbi:MAG: hypothetical protein QGG40_07955 [Myxococcota bacterium]|nr:hypothetical protein [Myxococcota bacterium]
MRRHPWLLRVLNQDVPGPITGLLALALWSCDGLGDRSDAQNYARALAEVTDFSAARSSCDRVDSSLARGDCLLAIMEAHERLDETDCRTLDNDLWHDECFFLLAERQAASGGLAQGLDTCQTTAFARYCSWHLLQDEVQDSLQEPAAEAEARLTAFRETRTLPDAAFQFWTIRFREQAGDGRPLDERDCTGLEDSESCIHAVQAHIRKMLDARARAARKKSSDTTPSRPAVCELEPGSRVKIRQAPAWSSGPVAQAAESDWVRDHCR